MTTEKRSFGFHQGLQRGKSHHQAQVAAAMLRAGKKVALASFDPATGEVRLENVVSVPGLPDGTQLPNLSNKSAK